MTNIRHNFTCHQDFRAYLDHCSALNATCHLLIALSIDCMGQAEEEEDTEFYESVNKEANGLLTRSDTAEKETTLEALKRKIVKHEFGR